MIVYCDVEDCKHNDIEHGICECVWKTGTQAITIEENYMGIPFCADFEQKERENGED